MLSLFLLRKILFWFSAGAKPRREYKGSLPIYPNIPPKIPHPTHKLCYRPSMKKRSDKMDDELRPEYDLRQLLKSGARGKYAKRYRAGTNLVLLDPDIRKAFRNEKAVNEALRLVLQLRRIGASSTASSGRAR